MSTLSQFFGGGQIKSIQRGTILKPNNTDTATATISSVNTSKTFINFLGFSSDLAASIRIELTNSTTITATTTLNFGRNVVITVSYEVIEYA